MKVVVDTNIIISSLIASHGYVAQVMRACEDEAVQLILARPQLVEIGKVLHRPKIHKYLRWDDDAISSYIHNLSTFADVVPGTLSVEVTEDPTDNMLFAAAIEGGAQYIISGDHEHVLKIGVYRGIQTITPKEFVQTVFAYEQ